MAQLEGWIRDMELRGSDRRFGPAISLNALALRVSILSIYVFVNTNY